MACVKSLSRVAPRSSRAGLGWLAPASSPVPEGGVLRRCEPTRQPPPAAARRKAQTLELRALPALPAAAERRASVPERSYANGSLDFEGNEILVLIFILISLPAGILLLELSPWR